MTRFNVRDTRTATATGPIEAKTGKPKTTHQGGVGYVRTPQSELFLLATTGLDITAATFYVGGDERVERYVKLTRKVAVTDPRWVADFLAWLRGPGNIRTAAIVAAVEAARAMTAAKIPGGRAIVNSVCQRPDEPGEVIAYHLARYGRNLPKPIKRGLADAVARLYSEKALLKYDTASHAVRFGDVIDMTHPIPGSAFVVDEAAADVPADEMAGWVADQERTRGWFTTRQSDLFRYALDRRHGRDTDTPESLTMVNLNKELRADAVDDPSALIDSARLAAAGMTWEDALSLAGTRVPKVALWTALISAMNDMALLRNLRNFDEAELPDELAAQVAARIADPERVARSRQLPMRYLSAYRHAPSLRWAYPLEQALDHAVGNIPALPGRTLVLIDTSQSMDMTFSTDGTLKRWDAAVMFGLALARRCASADVVSFSDTYYGGDGSKVFPMVAGESLLKSIERWRAGGYFIAGGTDTEGAARRHLAGHDRVVILTDEQQGRAFYTGGDVDAAVPKTTPLYIFNLAGYQTGSIVDNPNRVTLSGLTDQMLRLIPQVEAGATGSWPWVTA